MTAPAIYTMSPITLNTTTLAASEIRLSTAVARQLLTHSGNLFPSVATIPSAIPMVTFKTPLKDALTLIGTGLLKLTACSMYGAKFTNYIKDATSVHAKFAATAGCAYISGWSAGQNRMAMADVVVALFSTDGSTHPLARTDNNALPTVASEPLLHTIGPVSINGSVITGANTVTVSFNHTLDIRISDGDSYPRNAALLAGGPTIGYETLDPMTLETTSTFVGVAISSVIVYFKSYDATTQLVSTANSVSVTMGSGRVILEDVSERQNEPNKGQVTIIPMSASATHPFVTSTAATAPST